MTTKANERALHQGPGVRIPAALLVHAYWVLERVAQDTRINLDLQQDAARAVKRIGYIARAAMPRLGGVSS